ncbi:MAG: hypothetical protein JEZ11_20185 [Desulfobacterales bacterium]|nr:hypothetical protein [Desulfobacterales bacterium]
MRSIPWVLAVLMMGGVWAGTVLALSPGDWVRLQKAGVGPGVIEALVHEKAVETGAVSMEDVLALKAAGVTDETLCLVVRAGSFIRDRKPRVYGSGIRPVHLATIGDLLELKAAGMDEQTLRAVILSGARDTEALRRQEAMAWIEKMGLRIDMRAPQP